MPTSFFDDTTRRAATWRFGILLLYACLLPAGAALACGPAPGGPPGACSGAVAGLGASGGPDAGAGNPINVITGNKYQREDDLPALPGVLGLEIVRHYNSAYSLPGASNGPLGREWKLSYETELFDKFGRIQVVQADGARIIFERDRRDPGLCATAAPANGRMTLSRQANGAPDYTWALPDGRRLHFNQWGKLDSIRAASGETLRLFYDRDQSLLKVTDPQGRSLHLMYADRAGRQFRGVRQIDSPVGRFSYEYGGAAPQGAVPFDRRILLANLLRVRAPAGDGGDGAAGQGASRLYHHEDPRLPWLLTGISIESPGAGGEAVAARYATFGYDGNGRANLSTHAGGVGKVTLDTATGGQTVLTNSLGQRTVYRHAIVGDAQRLLEVRGAGCASCGETNVRYAYDNLGQWLETTRLDADGQAIGATRRELDALGRTVRIGQVTYLNGKAGAVQWRVRFDYAGDAQAPAVISGPSVVPGKERQTRVAYNGFGQVLSETQTGWTPGANGEAAAPIARTTRYGYATINGRSLLTRIDGLLPNGKSGGPLDSDVTLFEYDGVADGASDKKATAPDGKLSSYDERKGRRDGVLSAMITPGNVRRAFTYDSAGRLASVTDAAGRVTRLGYTPRGQLARQTGDGVTDDAIFDAMGNPVEIGHGDSVGRQSTRFGYDGAGRLSWSASPLGMLVTRRYDTENRVIDTATRSSVMRQTRSYAYDEFGHLLSVTDGAGGGWSVRWNGRGLPEELTDALGRVTRYRHDAAGRLIGVTPVANAGPASVEHTETRFERDINGDIAVVTGPNGAVTRYSRDDFGQVVATVSADSGTTRRRFDAAGRLTASSDANGNEATYDYDTAGRIVRQSITDADAGPGHHTSVTSWRYAGASLVAIDDPAQSERYRHDEHGRLTGKTIIVTLDGGKQASYETRYRYDGAGQLQGVSLPDGSVLDYRRNGQRQIVAIERATVHSAPLRWLLPASTIVKDLRRDIVGLQHMTYGNGIEADYQRSGEGVLARIAYRDPRDDGGGQTPGAALQALLGIGPAAAASNNTQPQLPGALGLPPDAAALLDHRYLWDAQGNLLHAKEKDGAGSYAYDAFDRLIAAASSTAQEPASFERYHFDGAGNRLLAQQGIGDQGDLRGDTVKTGYTADSNRWQGAASYDASGQPGRIGQRDYRWDALGKLIEVRQGKELLARYRYNHRGQRIAKDALGVHTHYLYDDDRKLLAELDADGKITRQYIYLAGQPVALIDSAGAVVRDKEAATPLAQALADMRTIWRAWFGHGERIAFLHGNHLGATELITDADGKPVWQAAYAPFGKLRKAPGAFRFNLRLPGQYADAETGLYYNDSRYYDPAQGRYLTPDPLGLRASGNAYAYVDGNPLKYIDPSGLILFAFDGTGNSETPKEGSAITNVIKFQRAYDEAVNGPAFYITGIGTTNKDMPYAGSSMSGDGFDQRITLGLTFLNDYIK